MVTSHNSTSPDETRGARYEIVWGRRPDMVFSQSDDEDPHIDIFRFPPTRKFWAPAFRDVVYVTAGICEREMNVPPGIDVPTRIELSAFVVGAPPTAEDGRDLVAWTLHNLAHAPFREAVFLAPGHTLTWGGIPLIEGSAMSGFLFGVTPGVDLKRLCWATGQAGVVVHVVPISAAEIELAVNQGTEALLDLFHQQGVPAVFDLSRRSAI